MSSFKRKVKSSSGDEEATAEGSAYGTASAPQLADTTSERGSGVKPWVSTGLGIVSSGSRSLDDILGGGVPLGSTMMYLIDAYSNHGASLLSYHCAESLSHRHHTAVLASSFSIDAFRHMLPTNRNLDPEQAVSTAMEGAAPSGLTIAWQYEKYLAKVKEQAAPICSDEKSMPFCCSFDLSKRLQASLETRLAHLVLPESVFHLPSVVDRLDAVLDQLRAFVSAVRASAPRGVTRVFVPDLHELLATCSSSPHLTSQALARFALRLKRLVWDSKLVVCVALDPKALPARALQTLEQGMDTVLAVESFSSRMHALPYEFNRFHAFLVVHKLQQCGMLAPFKPSASRFGIIRDRRKVNIEPLHLPPEESRAFPSSNTSSSGGCSSTSLASAPQPVTQSESAGDGHGHTHSHLHSHSHASAAQTTPEPPKTGLAASLAAARAARQTAVGSGDAPVKTSGLAGSLAAARVARQAGAQPTAAKVQPISITGARPLPAAAPSLDF